MQLGQSPGGGLVYLEPPGVVGLNNDLLAARAEAMAAEEAVLWDLSARLMGVLEEVEEVGGGEGAREGGLMGVLEEVEEVWARGGGGAYEEGRRERGVGPECKVDGGTGGSMGGGGKGGKKGGG